MTRRTILLVLLAAMLGWALPAWSQPNKLFRIGYLANDPEPNSPTFVEFRQTLAKQGWRVDFVNENIKEGANREERVANANVVIYYSPERKGAGFAAIAGSFVERKVDLMVTTGSNALNAAFNATKSIPIVFGSLQDPGPPYVKSLREPGGNVTGLATHVAGLAAKRVEFMHEMLPRARVLGRLYQVGPTKPDAEAKILAEDKAAADARELRFEQFPVVVPEDAGRNEALAAEILDKAFGQMKQKGVGIAYVKADQFFVVHRDVVAAAALKHGMPILCADGRFTDAGALFSYGDNFPLRYQRAALVVDRILRGEKPAVTPVDESLKPELVINLKTAAQLGIAVPNALRVQEKRAVR